MNHDDTLVKSSPFEMIDPFNDTNTIKGDLLVGGPVYGDLRISHVNGKEVNQYIRATPKFVYPGNRSSPRFNVSVDDFPDVSFKAHEKLDGTNILMYKYVDVDGNEFWTYKTRLTPLLRKDGFKDWISLLKKAIDVRPDLIESFKQIPGNHAFEMYGFLNEVLIKYDVSIDLRYLYTVNDKGLSYVLSDKSHVLHGRGRVEAVTAYKYLVNKAEELFLDGKRAEGFMFYFDDGTIYKCKPVCVVEEQSDSPFISKDDVYFTAMSAAETINDIDELFDVTKILLAEVYDNKKIERSVLQIEMAVREAKDYLLMQKTVLSVMNELGLTWSDDNKSEIMRQVMKKFPKNMSSKVYGMLSGKGRKQK